MIYRMYGRTGKKVSAVGFGGMRFDTNLPKEQNAELVRYANSKGINYFDTAPGYCSDQSEDIFGIAFKEMPGQFYTSTKGMPTEFETADKARAAVEKSLKRLGVPKIHFYHVWCLRKWEHYELAMKKGGQYEGLLKAKQDGLIEHIVCSTHMPGAEVRRIVEDGRFDGILLGVNILNFPYRWEGVQSAYEHGVGIVAMNPLAGGLIPQNEDKLPFLRTDGEPPVETALRFCIGCPQITVTLVGLTTREQVDAACRVGKDAREFSADELRDIRRHISGRMNEVCTGCGYCKGCPKNIPVASYMQFYNQKQLFGLSDDAMIKQLDFQHNWMLLASRKAGADECVECGMCEEKCTQHLNIIERLKEIAQWEKAVK